MSYGPEQAAGSGSAKKGDAKRRSKKTAGDTKSDAGSTGAYIYGTEEANAVMSTLDKDMVDVAKATSKYPKQVPACLGNLNLDRILSGELLGRSLAKAGNFFCGNKPSANHLLSLLNVVICLIRFK